MSTNGGELDSAVRWSGQLVVALQVANNAVVEAIDGQRSLVNSVCFGGSGSKRCVLWNAVLKTDTKVLYWDCWYWTHLQLWLHLNRFDRFEYWSNICD